MENYQWEGITQFIFPEEVGSIDEVVSVNVKPQWQQEETEHSLRLIGIYLIQSAVRFNNKELPNYSEGILIDTLEFNGNEGYFEYAYPLEVDLPKELVKTGKPRLEVSNVQFFVLDGSCCTFRWDVQCIIEPIEEVEEKVQEKHEQLHIVIESSSSSSNKFHQSEQLPEHIDDIQYEINLKPIFIDEDKKVENSNVNVEMEETADEALEHLELTQQQLPEHKHEVEDDFEQTNEEQEQVLQQVQSEKIEESEVVAIEQENTFTQKDIEFETKNVLNNQENHFIQEGYISNIRHNQPSDLSPIRKQTIQDEEQTKEVVTKEVTAEQSSAKEVTIDTAPVIKTFGDAKEVDLPIITKGQKIFDSANDKDQESDDFLESLREDYTVFHVSNNILRK